MKPSRILVSMSVFAHARISYACYLDSCIRSASSIRRISQWGERSNFHPAPSAFPSNFLPAILDQFLVENGKAEWQMLRYRLCIVLFDLDLDSTRIQVDAIGPHYDTIRICFNLPPLLPSGWSPSLASPTCMAIIVFCSEICLPSFRQWVMNPAALLRTPLWSTSVFVIRIVLSLLLYIVYSRRKRLRQRSQC